MEPNYPSRQWIQYTPAINFASLSKASHNNTRYLKMNEETRQKSQFHSQNIWLNAASRSLEALDPAPSFRLANSP